MTKSTKHTEKAGTTLLTLVVDRSGSMEPIKDDMEGGIKTLIEEQAREEGTCLVTLAQFDNEYEVWSTASRQPRWHRTGSSRGE